MKKGLVFLMTFWAFVSAVSAEGVWTAYTSGNKIRDITARGDRLWCAALGGVACWDVTAGEYTLYTTDDGLPLNDVTKVIVQDDTNVWAVTARGLCRLENNRWVLNTPVPRISVDMAAAGADGRLYARTYYGIHVYDGESWSLYADTDETVRNGSCYDMLITGSGNMYCSFWGYGIWKYNGEKWESITEGDGLRSDTRWRFALAHDGDVWAAGSGGVIEIEDSEGMPFTDLGAKEHLANYSNYEDITVSADGAICILGWDFVAKVVDGAWEKVYQFYDDHYMGIACDSGGGIYLGNWRNGQRNLGLYSVENAKFLTISDGPSGTVVYSLCEAPDGSIWMATSGGVTKWSDNRWSRPLFEDENLYGQPYPSPDGSVWIFSSSQGLFRIFDAAVERFGIDDGLPDEVSSGCLAVAPDGTVNAALHYVTSISTEGGLYCFDGTRWNAYPESETLSSSRPAYMAVTGDGILWMVIGRTLYKYVNNEPVRAENAPQADINRIKTDNNGRLWVAADSGVYLVRDDVWEEMSSRGCDFMCPGKDTTVWQAVDDRTEYNTPDTVLFKVDGDGQERIEIEDGMTRTRVLDMLADSRGNIWVGTESGLFVYSSENGVFVEKTKPAGINASITSISPNPFNPSTTIGFSLPLPGSAELSVYNVLGQKVRTLVSEQLSGGLHTVQWDGKNDSGHDLSSGVYIAGIRSGRYTATKKMLLQR